MSDNPNGTATETEPIPSPAEDTNGSDHATQTTTQTDPKWMKERLDQNRRSTEKKILEQYGLKSLDDIKVLLDTAKNAEDAKLTERQKLEADLEVERKEKAKLTKAQEKLDAEKAELLTMVDSEKKKTVTVEVNAALALAAHQAKAEHPKDVVRLLREDYATDVAALVNDQGVIDEAAVQLLIEKVKDARRSWFTDSRGGVGSPSNYGGSISDKVKKELEERARKVNRRIISG